MFSDRSTQSLKYQIDPVDYSRMRVNLFWEMENSGLPEHTRELMREAYNYLTIMQTKRWTCEDVIEDVAA